MYNKRIKFIILSMRNLYLKIIIHRRNYMENKGKVREHGITLVALVITIIILLILAGIAITGLTQTGLFEKARQAKNETENAQIEENVILGSYENKINEVAGGVSGSRDDISESEELRKQKTMSEEEHFTGEYYLDNKPIYAKTIYIDSLPNAEKKQYEHNIKNIDEVWIDASKTYIKWKEGIVGLLPHISSESIKYNIEITLLDKEHISIYPGIDRRELSAYITLNYTKTID